MNVTRRVFCLSLILALSLLPLVTVENVLAVDREALEAQVEESLKQDSVERRQSVDEIFQLGDIYADERDVQQAIRLYQEGLKVDGWRLEYQFKLAKLLAENGAKDRAVERAHIVYRYSEDVHLIEESKLFLINQGAEILERQQDDGSLGPFAVVLVPMGPVNHWLIDEARKELHARLGIDYILADKGFDLGKLDRTFADRYLDQIMNRITERLSADQMQDILGELNLKESDLKAFAGKTYFIEAILGQTGFPRDLEAYKENLERLLKKGQHDAQKLVNELKRRNPKKGDARVKAYLGVTEADIFSGDNNFLFGYAARGHGIFSYHRFLARFHGGPPNRPRLRERFIKQAISSTFFTLGIPRCTSPMCARAYPNSIVEHDQKGGEICSWCKEQLRSLMEVNASDVHAHRRLGALHQELGDYGRAVQLYDAALQVSPDDFKVYFEKGMALQEQGLYEKAIETYEAYVQKGGTDAAVYHRLAECYEYVSDRKQAAKMWDIAASKQAEGTWKHILLGHALSARGNHSRAVVEYKRATEMSPDNPFGYYSLGNVYKYSGDYQSAIRAYERAIAVRPDFSHAHSNLALLYREKLNNLEKALSVYHQAQEVFPNDVSLYVAAGDLYLSEERTQEAEVEFAKALRIQPTNTDALYNLGYIHFERKDYAKALQLAQKIQEVNPSSPDSYWLFKHVAHRKGRWKDAVEAGENYIRFSPPEHIDGSDYHSLGYAYGRLGQYDKIIEAYQKFVRKSARGSTQWFYATSSIIEIKACSLFNVLWLWRWLEGIDRWLGQKMGYHHT